MTTGVFGALILFIAGVSIVGIICTVVGVIIDKYKEK